MKVELKSILQTFIAAFVVEIALQAQAFTPETSLYAMGSALAAAGLRALIKALWR